MSVTNSLMLTFEDEILNTTETTLINSPDKKSHM